eukprot:TRINITY_DN7423_c0_g1_i2.p1 TRINITY_DN7423_c0_g1~~TRINITY_DN7423_c0_g1_i2.p1  ORF type:complete len:202 (-),score=42.64 TRINITY_DN7423_c0_g1_i2:84-689(-)
MANLLGVIRLTVVSGRNLRTENDTADPMMVITYGAQKLQSEAIPGNPNPAWNQEFFLHATSGAAQVISVVCIDQLSQAQIGEAKVALPKIWKDKYSDDSWFALTGSKFSAAVHLRLTYREIRSFVSELMVFKTSRDELKDKLDSEIAKNTILEDEKRKLQQEIEHYKSNRPPAWIPDDNIENCMRCGSAFGVFRRKVRFGR